MYCVRESVSQEQLVTMAQEGDMDALEELFLSVQGFIYKKSHQYAKSSTRYDVDDIFGFGCEAFMKAVKDFDSSRGLKFITILGTYFFNYYHSKFYAKERRSRTYEAISRLEDTVGVGDSGDEITLMATLIDTPRDETVMYVEDIVSVFNEVLHSCTERDSNIIILYVNGNKKQKEISELYGISDRTVSKIINDFRRKLKSELEKLDLL